MSKAIHYCKPLTARNYEYEHQFYQIEADEKGNLNIINSDTGEVEPLAIEGRIIQEVKIHGDVIMLKFKR